MSQDDFITTNLKINKVNHGKQQDKHKINYFPLSLFVKDLKLIQNNDGTIKHKIYQQQFDRVMICGRLMVHRTNDELKRGVYSIDDGTGKVLVYFSHNQFYRQRNYRQFENIKQTVSIQAREGIASLGEAGEPTTPEFKNTMDALEIFINIIDKRLATEKNYFKNNTNVFVIGVPFVLDSQINISAYQMYIAEKNDSLYWDFLLVDLYENKYLK